MAGWVNYGKREYWVERVALTGSPSASRILSSSQINENAGTWTKTSISGPTVYTAQLWIRLCCHYRWLIFLLFDPIVNKLCFSLLGSSQTSSTVTWQRHLALCASALWSTRKLSLPSFLICKAFSWIPVPGEHCCCLSLPLPLKVLFLPYGSWP